MTRNYRTILSPLLPWLVFLMALSISGCSIKEQAPPQVEATQVEATQLEATQPREIPENVVKKPLDDEQVMIDDLLSALVQLFPPRDNTIQISAADDNELTLLVADTMARIGFGIQKVTTDQGAALLTTDKRAEEQSDDSSHTKHLRIDIGQISIGRAYSTTKARSVLPSSPYKLYGTRAAINLDTTLFGANSAMASTQYVAPIGLDEPLPLLSLIAPDIVQSTANENSSLPELTSVNSARVEVNNLHFGESAFGSVLNDYLIKDDLIVIFPNDSLTLGSENKLIIRQFMEGFIEQLDLVNVIGCSNGPTDAEMGNEGLALGRGKRVTDELLSIGVPREKILDQGCWAPSAGGKYPGRGVVLELWRVKG